jgi:hypothetical protein
LISKEVVSVNNKERWQSFSRVLNIAIIPLLLAFVLIVVMEVLQILR